MPHQYALHTDVEARCLCCESMQHFVFASPSDHVVCEHCRRHLGDEKAERRDREHVALWRGIVAARDATIAPGLNILYGGSVKGSNARALFAKDDIDGGLVGGASLVASDFLEIFHATA